MGTIKALLPWKGLPLIEYQVQQLLKTSIKNIVIVLGYQAPEINQVIEKYPIHIIYNPNYANGKTSSIKTGIRALKENSCSYLIVSVDNPIESSIIEMMLKQLRCKNSNIVIPVYSNKRGHPILLNGSLRDDILSISEQKMGLKELIAKYQSSTSELHVTKEHVLYNLNTKEDYICLKDHFERRHQQ
ncbi:nucleotidyltransferase family protein [Neobacillus notoginsengisoli]|uniref:Nucleotidyltransferase family protein n=2 Tax=Neobacillus notoginsengisoli TaxID=1578198 RepID=A0A417YVY4_9BACI|nr:nucleotidyltransferase family protein [Neobacillus notoginsengisoli]